MGGNLNTGNANAAAAANANVSAGANANANPNAAMNVNANANANINASATPGDAQYYELLEQLQVLDFALVELNLFLDTHPGDLRSIQQFNQLTQERTRLANYFQELYGPLQNFGRAYSRCPWEWIETPWPWQV